MLRIVCEIKPKFVVGENVKGILSIDNNRTFGRILADLAKSGYRVGWLCYGAGDVGAPHKRERVFIVAYDPQETGQGKIANGDAGTAQSGVGMLSARIPDGLAGHRWPAGWWPTPISRDYKDGTAKSCKNVPVNSMLGRAVHRSAAKQHPWEPPRIATGVKDRVAKLKALGNAVVPAQAYPIFRAIMETEVAGCMKRIVEVGE